MDTLHLEKDGQISDISNLLNSSNAPNASNAFTEKEEKVTIDWTGKKKVRVFGNHHFYVNESPIPSLPMTNPAIVVLACRRKEGVLSSIRTLQSLPFIDEFSLYVSIGCPEEPIRWEFDDPTIRVLHYQDPPTTKGIPKPFLRIQLHYQFLLKELFEVNQHSHVIILEDDLGLSRDLLNFFKQTASLLEADPSLVCVSAFNDQALGEREDPLLLKRSSSFPNLALLFARRGYDLLWRGKPLQDTTNGWDHWLRVQAASMQLECVYPVLPRVRHLITEKSSTATKGFAKKLASYPMAGEDLIDLGDLSYLIEANYDHSLLRMVLHPHAIESTYQQMRSPYRKQLGSQTDIPIPSPELQSTDLEEQEVIVIDGRRGKNVVAVKRYVNRMILVSTLREVGVGCGNDGDIISTQSIQSHC